jgi:hypothetical protein
MAILGYNKIGRACTAAVTPLGGAEKKRKKENVETIPGLDN